MVPCRVDVVVTAPSGDKAGFSFLMRGMTVKTVAALLRSVLSCYIK